ncbi:MAG: response regulator [Planctomycetes bacterium]|nr:response regulator [Planctomycetota bacterium]
MTNNKTILIADDDTDLCNAVASRCRKLGLDAVTACDAAAALRLVESSRPDLICLDVDMPRGNGLAVCEMIAGDEYLSSVPVIIMTGKSDSETVQRCHNLCAYYVTKAGEVWSRLEPLIRELLDLEPGANMNELRTTGDLDHRREEVETNDPILDAIFSALGVDERFLNRDVWEDNSARANLSTDLLDVPASNSKPWILHVDDDTDLSNALKMRLETYGISVVQAFDGIDGVRHAFTTPADLIILDYQMPHGNGEYVLRRLKQCEATRRIPVIVLTGRRDQGLEQQMLSLGADRFLNKPIRFDVLLDEVRRFVSLQEPRGDACLMV